MTDTTPFWGPDFDSLREIDPDIADVLISELDRLRGGLTRWIGGGSRGA